MGSDGNTSAEEQMVCKHYCADLNPTIYAVLMMGVRPNYARALPEYLRKTQKLMDVMNAACIQRAEKSAEMQAAELTSTFE